MIKLLAIGDPHFQITNMDALNTYIERICNIITMHSIDKVIILGDLLHNHEKLHTLVLNKAIYFIETLASLVPTFVIVGNHDYINNTQFLSTNHWMNCLKNKPNIFIVDTGHVDNTTEGKCIMVPYVFPGRFREALNQIDQDWNRASLIFCHQEFKGCKMGAIVSEEGDYWDSNEPMIIAGHIHDKQSPQANIFYTGSSMQHAFGESHDKTISIITLNNGEYSIENVSLNMAKKKIVYMDIDEVKKFNYKPTEDKLRITLKGDIDEFKLFKKSSKYKTLVKKGVKIVYKQKKIENIEHERSESSEPSDFFTLLFNKVKNDKKMLELYNEYVKHEIK